MTKLESIKCEKLMEEAIQKVKQANDEYAESEMQCNNEVARQVSLRKADQHYGEAIGINQALVILGFKHDRMKELEELLYYGRRKKEKMFLF